LCELKVILNVGVCVDSAIKNFQELVDEPRSETLRTMRQHALEAVDWAIRSVLPKKLLTAKLRVASDQLVVGDQTFNLKEYDQIYVIGGGKAAPEMASALVELLGDKISAGEVAAKVASETWVGHIRLNPASHPIPDQRSVEATRKILDLVSKATDKTLFVTLISGGASAMLAYPRQGLTIEDKAKTTKLLLECGADIEEINTVRKHLSAIKGGQLQRQIYPATNIALIISDVVGDRLEVIASGPTVPDPTTFADAYNVLKKYGLLEHVPPRVLSLIERGVEGLEEDTPKPRSRVFDTAHNYLVGSNIDACMAAWRALKEKGYEPLLMTTHMQGEAREVAKLLAGVSLSCSQPDFDAYVLGGETTVTVKGRGVGGRNQELCLSALIALKGSDNVVLASVGTDGIDGFSEAAGAIVDGHSYYDAQAKNVSPEQYLENNDSATFFRKVGGAIITGPTGTNVSDIVVVLKRPPSAANYNQKRVSE